MKIARQELDIPEGYCRDTLRPFPLIFFPYAAGQQPFSVYP